MSYSSDPRSIYRQYSSAGSSSENLPPRTLARVARELRNLHKNPPEGVRLFVDGQDPARTSSSSATTMMESSSSSSSLTASSPSVAAAATLPTATASTPHMSTNLEQVVCEMQGPTETPYEGRCFVLKLTFSQDFPAAPPQGFFLTKIYHPNVDPQTGAICVNTLKRDWTAETTLAHVLAVIRCLLIVPFPESSLNDEAGKLFMESYQEYAKRAKLMAQVHGRVLVCNEENATGANSGGKTDPTLSSIPHHNGSTGEGSSPLERGVLKKQASNASSVPSLSPGGGANCKSTSSSSLGGGAGGSVGGSSAYCPLRNNSNNKKVAKSNSGAKMTKKKSLKRL